MMAITGSQSPQCPIHGNNLKTYSDFESLRFNKDIYLQKIKKRKLSAFCRKFFQKTLTYRINSFMEFMTSEIKE